MNKDLSFDSLDGLKDYLKVLYQTKDIAAVKEWIIDNLAKGTELSFKEGPSGNSNESVHVCDRRMELLDKNGIHVINKEFLPLLTKTPENSGCTLCFSIRVLFVAEPFGLVVYKTMSQ